MRKVFWAIMVLAALYAGYWVVGSRLADHALRNWFTARHAQGWTASYDELKVRGFPSRFDVTIKGLDLLDSASGFGWKAPQVEFDALSYQPQHYVATWPQAQTLLTPAGPVAIASTKMQASLVFIPGPSFRLNRSQLVVTDLAVKPASDTDLAWAAARMTFATARAPATGNGQRVGLELDGLELPPAALANLGPGGTLPATVDRLHVDAVVDFDRPWDRHAVEEGNLPRPTHVRLADLSLTWGAMAATVTGELAIDAAGVPEGALQVRAPGWRGSFDLLTRAGLIPASSHGMILAALTFAAAAGGGGEDLSVTLGFSGGAMTLGALPIGPAPRLFLP